MNVTDHHEVVTIEGTIAEWKEATKRRPSVNARFWSAYNLQPRGTPETALMKMTFTFRPGRAANFIENVIGPEDES